jgi:hypothetical protein
MSGLLPRTQATQDQGSFQNLSVNNLVVNTSAYIQALDAGSFSIGAITVGDVTGNPNLAVTAGTVTINSDTVTTNTAAQTLTNKTIDSGVNTITVTNGLLPGTNINLLLNQPLLKTSNPVFGGAIINGDVTVTSTSGNAVTINHNSQNVLELNQTNSGNYNIIQFSDAGSTSASIGTTSSSTSPYYFDLFSNGGIQFWPNNTSALIIPAAGIVNNNSDTNILTINSSTNNMEYLTVASLGIPAAGTSVTLSGAQTITGVKTFTAAPIIGTITNTGTLTLPTTTGTLALVSQIPTNSTYVDLTSNQTAAGTKQFSGQIKAIGGAASTSTSTGDIVVTGGLGCGGAIFSGGAVTATQFNGSGAGLTNIAANTVSGTAVNQPIVTNGSSQLVNVPYITATQGGTGIDSSASTGLPYLSSAGTWAVNKTQSPVMSAIALEGVASAGGGAAIQMNNVTNNRKIVMYDDGAPNNYQFYGFGVSGNTVRYNADQTSTDHVFFAGINSTSVQEVFRIKGNQTGAVTLGGISFGQTLICTSSTPTIAVGSAAGTGATASISGTGTSGNVTINFVTLGGTSGTVATITIPNAISTTTFAPIIFPNNTLAATGAINFYTARASSTTWNISATTTITTGTYQWSYIVI